MTSANRFLFWLRLLLVFSPGYEFFQSVEILAGDVFGVDALRPWEFNATSPIRSIAAPGLMCGAPYIVMKYLLSPALVHSALLVFVPRILLFTLSFVHDRTIVQLGQAMASDPSEIQLRLGVLRSSWAFVVFLSRTFSNTVEALMLSLALQLLLLPTGWAQAALLGVVVASGVWTRFTFLFFVAPIAFHVLLRLFDLGRRSPLRALLLALTCAYSFLSCAVALTLLDTLYYTQRPYSVASLVRSLVVTPWNNLKYNSNAANLALHGLHPHYTHLVANLPILLGPLAPLCLYGACRAVGATSVGAQTWRLRLTLACVVATGVGVLSLAPHQEARFLLPLLVPLILLAPAPPLRRRWFVAVWLAFNVAMVVVMGVLHQGGVVPSLVLRSASLHAHLVYSNTYMPPRSLLLKHTPGVALHDLAGAEATELWAALATLNATLGRDTHIHLLQPGALAPPLGLAPIACYAPHLSTEALTLAALVARPWRALALCEYRLPR